MISEHIRRNIYYLFVFNQTDHDSIYWALKMLQVDPKNARLLSSLLPGKCVFRQTLASWAHAFLCQIDYIPPARNIGMLQYHKHSFIPSLSKEQSGKIIQELYESIKEKTEINNAQKPSELEIVSLKILRLRAENPYTPVARLFDKLGSFHYTFQIKVREFLEKKGFAAFEEARIGRTTMLLMQLKEAGYNIVQMPMPKENMGRGGITHRHYAKFIKSHFEKKGNKAYLEWVVPGTNHPVDVGVEFENHFEIFEICVTITKNMVNHLEVFEKNPNIKSLTIITGTKIELDKIRKLIKGNVLLSRFKDRIRLDVIENYMGKS